MTTTLAEVMTAKRVGNAHLTHTLATTLMIDTATDANNVETYQRATRLYAWALGELGLYGASLQYWRLTQGYYARPDGMLSFAEAAAIVQQVQLLNLLEIPVAATALREELEQRIDQETSGAVRDRIRREVDAMLASSKG